MLDVRTPPEHQAAHVQNVTLIPLDSLDPAAFVARRSKPDAPLYVFCQAGGRARKAIEKFQAAGFTQCVLVEGGMNAWLEANLPAVRQASSVLPLMQQVQITVGFLSSTGAALALFVNPKFAWIPLFIGCGLLFAGLTGTCALALLLAKMPWNRANPSCKSCN